MLVISRPTIPIMSHLFQATELENHLTRLFEAAGSLPAEARAVAQNLVLANLSGHDSHGVGMAPRYIEAILEKGLIPNTAVAVRTDVTAIDLTSVVEMFKTDTDRIQVSAAPGADGIVRRMQQPAREGSTNWAVFALANSGDEQIDRLIGARSGPAGRWSGRSIRKPGGHTRPSSANSCAAIAMACTSRAASRWGASWPCGMA